MVHWVLYASNESWNSTSKSRDVLYGDQHNIIKKIIKKKKKTVTVWPRHAEPLVAA